MAKVTIKANVHVLAVCLLNYFEEKFGKEEIGPDEDIQARFYALNKPAYYRVTASDLSKLTCIRVTGVLLSSSVMSVNGLVTINKIIAYILKPAKTLKAKPSTTSIAQSPRLLAAKIQLQKKPTKKPAAKTSPRK